MGKALTESRFYMWRTVVAMVHADGVVTPHELAFVNDYISDIELSPSQLEILRDDLGVEQDIYEMFVNIKNRQDKIDFFSLARALSWCDGDLDQQEKEIIDRLQKIDDNQDALSVLEESRELVLEVDICEQQWQSSKKSDKNIFGFFKKLKTA